MAQHDVFVNDKQVKNKISQIEKSHWKASDYKWRTGEGVSTSDTNVGIEKNKQIILSLYPLFDKVDCYLQSRASTNPPFLGDSANAIDPKSILFEFPTYGL